MKITQAGYVDIVRLALSLLMVKGRQEGWRRKGKKRDKSFLLRGFYKSRGNWFEKIRVVFTA
jgi:hypothetical protein